MEQYSNLNVHGKITQKAAQGTTSDDVVKYPTLTERVPVPIPEPTADQDEGKALIVNQTGDGFEFGEAGKVDDVQIGGATIVDNKIATIPVATSSAKGVVQTGTGITNSSGTISVTYGNTAGTACQGNDSRLSDARTPLSHTHGNLTNDGKLGTTANRPVVTTDGGKITAGSVTSPIAMNGTSITHDPSGVVSSGTLSKGSASKSVSVTVNQWGHLTSLSDQDIAIAESQVTGLAGDLSAINTAISTINGKIPSAASSDNQLADKAFVNSSIGTATAYFLGTYDVESLGLTDSATHEEVVVKLNAKTTWEGGRTPSNNDYCFVYFDLEQDPGNVDKYERYKYDGSTWAYEYTLNNSSFTDVQWATINSMVTNTSNPKVGVDVKVINEHLADSTIHVTASDKTTWNGKQNAITGAATTITSSDLTASRVLISNSSGKVAASTITTTELGYLDNVTEDIQAQIDTKFDTIAQDATGNYVSSISVDSNDPSTLNVTRATLPTLSGGQAATSGKYVSGVTVSGHTVTVTQADLPTLSGGQAATSGKYVSGVTVSGHAVTVTQANLPSLSKGTTTGDGNVVSDISVSGHTVTLTKGVTAVTKTGSSTANQVVLWNGTDSVVKAANQSALAPGVSIATDTGTNALTLAHGTKYKLAVGASTFIFTTPAQYTSPIAATDVTLADM